MASKPVYIVTWNTESADEGVLGYWTVKPTPDGLKEFMQDKFPDDFYAKTLYYQLHVLEKVG